MAHDSAPTWQGALGGVHGVLAAQATQLPPLQTWPLPQLEPSWAFPLITQTELPVEHEVFPTLQVVPLGTQSCAARQLPQTPPRQTWFGPQVVPSLDAVVVSTQVGVPCPQSRVPLWQGLPGTQGFPLAHAIQAPSLQTIPLPQLLPLVTLPLATHTG